MCQKCADDDREYTHLSDLAMMLTEAFTNIDGKDLPIILDDNAGDKYWNIFGVSFDRRQGIYRVDFKYGDKY